MEKTNHIKYLAFSISIISFLLLNFLFATKTLFGFDQFILKQTNYFFGITTETIDYFLISCIPIIALKFNKNTNLPTFLFNAFLIYTSTILVFLIGTVLLTTFGTLENPLIPRYLLVEPFRLYSAVLICIGISFPSIIKNLKTLSI
jgi:hypothetical protein